MPTKSNLIISGAKFLYIRKIINACSSIIVLSILAREISVESFGIVAIANTIMAFNVAVGNTTIKKYLIYTNDNSDELLQSSFWLNMILTFISSFIYLILAEPVAIYFNEPLLKDIIFVLLIIFIINQISVVPNAILEKKLDFKTIASRDIFTSILGSLIGVYMALSNYGIWSLIIPNLITSPIILVVTIIAAKWHPKLFLNHSYWKNILQYTLPLIGDSIIHTLNKRLDSLVIGKELGQISLGFYDISYQTAYKFDKFLMNPIKQIILPGLNLYKSEKQSVKEKMILTHKLIAFVSFPFFLFLFVFCEEMIFLLFGANWYNSVVPLMIIIPLQLRSSFKQPMNSIFLLYNKTKIPLKISLVMSFFLVFGLFLSAKISLIAVVATVVSIQLFFGEISFYFSRKIIDYSYMEILRNISNSLSFSIIAIIITFFISLCLESVSIKIIISFLSFSFIYFSLHRIFKTNELKLIYQLLKKIK
jgi:O-antigen/teichoic acid export membrane protein